MDWGHGFIPRIHRGNHKAVDRAIAHPSIYAGPLELPWVVAEAPWVCADPPLMRQLRDRGVKVVVDTQAWRYREIETFKTDKYRAVPYAPPDPLQSISDIEKYLPRDLAFQAAKGADVYLVPGFVPRSAGDDVTGLALHAARLAVRVTERMPPKPIVAFVGVRTRSLDAGYRLLEALPAFVQGVYIQFTPVDPMRDPPAKIVAVTKLMLAFRAAGFDVVGGRLGAMGNIVRSLGVAAADAGLGDGEAFDRASKLRPGGGSARGSSQRPSGARIYLSQIGRSVSGGTWKDLMSVPGLPGYLLCRSACCLFRQTGDSTLGRAREHSLFARTEEAAQLAALPESMRAQRVLDELEGARALLGTFNGALAAHSLPVIPAEYVENLTAAMRRLLGKPAAA